MKKLQSKNKKQKYVDFKQAVHFNIFVLNASCVSVCVCLRESKKDRGESVLVCTRQGLGLPTLVASVLCVCVFRLFMVVFVFVFVCKCVRE